MSITFSQLGKMGRTGNCLFQISATLGIAAKNNHRAFFDYIPTEISWMFKNKLPSNWNIPDNDTFTGPNYLIQEKAFHYNEIVLTEQEHDLKGYFQSEKYFKHIGKEIKNQFDFRDDVKTYCRSILPENGKKNIAIHVRRGDYVDNPSHYQLQMNYYLQAIHYMPKRWECNLIFFSDDIEFCKWHFQTLPNAYFIHNDDAFMHEVGIMDFRPLYDLCTMTLCDHFIIANSSFSWWGAYLGEKTDSIVVRPNEHFTGRQAHKDIKDLYPEHWIVKSDIQKVDISDVTFVIPVHYDHNDRAANLNLCVYHTQTVFNTNIHVIEQGSNRFSYTSDFAKYSVVDYDKFHRTRMINDAVKAANTPFVANYDADILLNPVQIWYAVHLLRRGCDVVYPYDGNFKHIPRQTMSNVHRNLYWLVGRKLDGPTESYGGAVFAHRLTYLEAGGENENFIAFGPEDSERFNRFCKLGLIVERVKGPLYHLDHHRGINSSKSNPHINSNRDEWHRVKGMNKEELINYIKTWQWIK